MIIQMILKLAHIIKNIWKKLKLMLNKDLREARIDSKYLATELRPLKSQQNLWNIAKQ